MGGKEALIFALALAISAVVLGIPVTGYLIWKQIGSGHQVKSFQRYKKERYANCDLMWKTARTEKEVYGLIVSGSVSSHVKDCNYCKYLMFGDETYLVQHRNEMRELEREWKP